MTGHTKFALKRVVRLFFQALCAITVLIITVFGFAALMYLENGAVIAVFFLMSAALMVWALIDL